MNTNTPAEQSAIPAASASELGSQFKLMYTKAEAAKMLSLSVRTIEYLIASKELTVRRVGKRVLVPYSSLLAFTRRDHPTGRVQ